MAPDERILLLERCYDEICFRPAGRFHWSVVELAIDFDVRRIQTEVGKFQLLHELGHALLGHERVYRPVEQWRHERDAWDVARVLAATSQIQPDLDYVRSTMGKYERRMGRRRAPQ